MHEFSGVQSPGTGGSGPACIDTDFLYASVFLDASYIYLALVLAGGSDITQDVPTDVQAVGGSGTLRCCLRTTSPTDATRHVRFPEQYEYLMLTVTIPINQIVLARYGKAEPAATIVACPRGVLIVSQVKYRTQCERNRRCRYHSLGRQYSLPCSPWHVPVCYVFMLLAMKGFMSQLPFKNTSTSSGIIRKSDSVRLRNVPYERSKKV